MLLIYIVFQAARTILLDISKFDVTLTVSEHPIPEGRGEKNLLQRSNYPIMTSEVILNRRISRTLKVMGMLLVSIESYDIVIFEYR